MYAFVYMLCVCAYICVCVYYAYSCMYVCESTYPVSMCVYTYMCIYFTMSALHSYKSECSLYFPSAVCAEASWLSLSLCGDLALTADWSVDPVVCFTS